MRRFKLGAPLLHFDSANIPSFCGHLSPHARSKIAKNSYTGALIRDATSCYPETKAKFESTLEETAEGQFRHENYRGHGTAVMQGSPCSLGALVAKRSEPFIDSISFVLYLVKC